MSPLKGAALLAADFAWGLKFCPLFLPGVAVAAFGYKGLFPKERGLPLGLPSPHPLQNTAPEAFKDSLKVSRVCVSRSVSWKP